MKFYIAGLYLLSAGCIFGQGIVDGKTNLLVNGDAESGPAGMDVKTPVSAIPGWMITGKPTVLPYNLTGNTTNYIQLTNPIPPDHGFQYFAAVFPSTPATLSQTIDVSSAASLIGAGNVKFTASAYLGTTGNQPPGAKVDVSFKNARGQTFSTTTVGPINFSIPGRFGMFFQQQIGLVPSGTTAITVTVTLQNGDNDTSVADSISLVLSQLSTTPVLGRNLIVNPGAEMGQGIAVPLPAHSSYVPGWSTTKFAGSVAPYGGSGFIPVSAPGPADRGVNVFCGWFDGADLYQDIDVSGASSLIDSNQVSYRLGAWLGGANAPFATLTYIFYDWSGTQLASTAQLSTQRAGTALVATGQTGTLPPGTRRVRISLNFPSDYSLVDSVEFTLSAPSGPPVITEAGIVSAGAFGGFSSIAPGSWIEIYGTNLASTTMGWSNSDFVNGVAPTSIGGITVTVGGRPAYVDYVSPGQVNALVPSDAPIGSGTSSVIVSNANGSSDPYPLYVNAVQPGLLAPGSLQISGKQYVAATLPDGTFAAPQGAVTGVASRPAKPGETAVIYGVGFGPVTDGVTAGTLVTNPDSLANPIDFKFGTTSAMLAYSGLAPGFTGLYQFNVVVPAVPQSDTMSFSVSLNGAAATQTLFISVGH